METLKYGDYEIREPVVGDVPGLFDLMMGAENADMKAIVNDLLRNCVYLDGEKLGDRLANVSIKDLRPMVAELMRMAGIAEKK